MNLVEILTEQSRKCPDAAAIIEARKGVERVTTFAELENQSAKIAGVLRRNGIGAGDAVLVFQPMSAELYAVLTGIFRLGAVAMFLDPSAGRKHIERCCGLLAPKALVACRKAHLLRVVSGALRRIPHKFVVDAWVPGAVSLAGTGTEPAVKEIEACGSDAPALITFTSGSTGLPKAAVRTHGFLLAQHTVLERRIELVAGEIDLATLPVFLLANLASGVTSVIPDCDLRSPGAIEPAPVLAQIARHRVTRCAASPAFFERLLGASGDGREALRGMRKIFTGGAPVFPRLLDQLRLASPDAEVVAVYGSTEAEPIAHIAAREISAEDRQAMRDGNGLIAGEIIPEIRLRVIRDRHGQPLAPMTGGEFEKMRMAAGSPGEIVVAGDHVMKGYLHGRGNEETKFSVDGETWHRTGDAGKLDDRGRLWLLGRCSAKIADEHGEIHPFAVECVAMEHVCVRRAAFVPRAGRRWLVVEPAGDFGEAERRALAKDLAWAKLDKIHAVARIPVDSRHNAKVNYPELTRMLR